jgi:hypothetical protein
MGGREEGNEGGKNGGRKREREKKAERKGRKGGIEGRREGGRKEGEKEREEGRKGGKEEVKGGEETGGEERKGGGEEEECLEKILSVFVSWERLSGSLPCLLPSFSGKAAAPRESRSLALSALLIPKSTSTLLTIFQVTTSQEPPQSSEESLFLLFKAFLPNSVS